MISLDCETTGLDPWHGSKPFLVTICNEQNEITCWEWDVDPLTREPQIPEEDKKEITIALFCEEVVLQNAKFDIRMLETIGLGKELDVGKGWDWSATYDTLLASHLLDSSKPKDLASSVLIYLGVDITPYEAKLREAAMSARRIAKRDFPSWLIAEQGLPSMPSAKATVWKNDLWLPRALYKVGEITEKWMPPSTHLDDSVPDEWETIASNYANIDSEATLMLFKEQEKLLKEKGLWKIYLQRLKVLPIAYEMESVGITLSENRLDELMDTYKEESDKSGRVCCNIAKGLGYELELPKSGNNNSLRTFVFDKLKLEPLNRSKKTGEPSLSGAVLDTYEETLLSQSKASRFIANLKGKRKRDTALNYMEGYKKFMLPLGAWNMNKDNKLYPVLGGGRFRDVDKRHWFVLHPSLNPTGTRTLRWSSQNPNEHNISKQEGFNLRYAFGPAPGREWWALDYSNLELRIPAYECQEPAMLDLFERPNDSPYFGSYHLLIFSILYPEEFREYGVEVKERFKSTLYQWTKNGNFAELYGAVDTHDGKSTADRAYHYPGAQAVVAGKLTKKSQLNQDWITYAKIHGYVETLPDRTVDPDHGYPLYCEVSNWGGISPTIPLNYHVQGTACWVIMQAMIKCQQYLSTLTGYRMVMQIHDEIVLDFPYKPNRGNLPKVNKVRHLMESCGDDIGISLTCGVDYHPNNWSEVGD